MIKTKSVICALCALMTACSEASQQSCTDDCRAYHRDPDLVNQVVRDTGLPLCKDASIFKTTRPAREISNPIADYEVQVVLEGYCPESLDGFLDKDGVATFLTSAGRHVTVSASIYSTYVISVWWASEKTVR